MHAANTKKFLISITAVIVVGTLLRIPGMDKPVTGDLAGMLLMHFPTSQIWEMFPFSDCL